MISDQIRRHDEGAVRSELIVDHQLLHVYITARIYVGIVRESSGAWVHVDDDGILLPRLKPLQVSGGKGGLSRPRHTHDKHDRRHLRSLLDSVLASIKSALRFRQ